MTQALMNALRPDDAPPSGLREDQSHTVQFYETDSALCDAVAELLAAGLREGDGLLVIATAAHSEALCARLRQRGVDVEGALASGDVALLDARHTLDRFLVGAVPDWGRFSTTICAALDGVRAGRGGRRVRAYGEMVDVLWREGDEVAALRVEEMWTDLQRTHAFSLLCAYVMASFDHEPANLQRVCSAHTHVVPPSEGDATGRHVRALVAEIAQRKGVERALRASARELRKREDELRRSQRELMDRTRHEDLREAALEASAARLELMYGLAAGVIGAETIDEVFTAALDALAGALGAERSSILAYDADGVLRFKAWRGLSEAYRRAVEGHSPWARDARAPEPVLVSDVETDASVAAYLPLLRREGIGSLGFIPLVAGGRLLGKFMVYYDGRHDPSPSEIDMAKAIANHVATAITRFAAIAELQRTVRFNETFTGILGHDLRNPLGAIMTATQLVLMRDESERLVKPLSRILTSGERMSRMIDQLLDFTRVRVGTGVPIEPVALDIVPVVRQAMDELDDANPAWAIRLEDAVGDTHGAWDPDRLAQVFSNLIANAVQHGIADRGVRVRIDGAARDEVCVEVHNMGAIPEALVPRLFEPMAGGDRRGHRSRGLGLGLYITQEIVKAHGGRIEVRSSDERGTSFILWLPRGLPAGREMAAS